MIVIVFAIQSYAQKKTAHYSYTEWHVDDCYAHFYCDSINYYRRIKSVI